MVVNMYVDVKKMSMNLKRNMNLKMFHIFFHCFSFEKDGVIYLNTSAVTDAYVAPFQMSK